MTPDFDALVLAGGHARRFGSDKLSASLQGRTVLDLALEATAGARTVVCVGPRRPTREAVTWVREDPPGSGPVPAVAAGLSQARHPWLLLLAGDMPFAAAGVASLFSALAAAAPTPHAGPYVAVSADGRLQPLLAVWPVEQLRRRVTVVSSSPRRSITALYDDVDLVRVLVDDITVHDIDAPDDLA
jgi:molybdenum cofactor guanylyltransferase